MKKLYFVSRHPLTNGQRATLEFLGFEGEQINISFGDNPEEDIVEKVGQQSEFAIVCPFSVGLDLLRKGYILYEFKNKPSARARGVFICEGVYKHSLLFSGFYPCPLTAEEQEEGSLNYGGGK